MSEAQFSPGDKVLVNGSVIATLEQYDVELNRVTWVTVVGRETNTTSAPLSHTQVESLAAALQAAVADQPSVANEFPPYASEHVTDEPVADKPNTHPDFGSLQ